MKDENFMHIVGERIRAFRKANKMTQSDLADKAGIHLTYLGDIERGSVNASIGVISSIINALDMSLSEFFSFLPKNEEKDWQKESDIAEILSLYRQFSAEKSQLVLETLRVLFYGLGRI